MTRIDDLLKKAKEMGMPAVAITDHGSMYGVFKFYTKALEKGIKPIIGVEAYKAKNSRFDQEPSDKERYHLTLIAKNYQGYKNLLKMVTAANIEGFYYKPRVDFELLEKYHEGVIATSGCLAGEIPSLLQNNQTTQAEEKLKKYVDIFGPDFYIEIQRHPDMQILDQVNVDLIKLSRKYGVPLVATNDVHYLEKDDAYAQEILLCIQTGRAIFEKDRPMSMIDNPDYYFKSPEEMRGMFLDLPEAIENTLKIAEQCNIEIPYGKLILPQYNLPEGTTADVFLRKLCESKLYKMKDFPDDVVKKRLDYELGIIHDKGYDHYFLFVQDFVNWAKESGIAVGPGRGSAAGSIVSYLLNITGINPLVYNLPFERFLNPERPSPPDIDMDFADVRRDEVLQYMRHTYGEEKVAQVITFGTMEARMAVRDVARALGMSYSQGDRISKMIPPPKQGFHQTLEQAIEDNPPLKLAYTSEPDTKKVIDISKKVVGLPRHASVHAAAVIIANKDLTEYVPLQKDPKEGRIVTQFDMYSLDLNVSPNAVGLMKMDILGLRNLTTLGNAIKMVEQTTGRKINIYEIPVDDQKTYELISKGETIGVFQLESQGMQRLCKDFKPTSISDLSAIGALYRPGPMELIPTFIENKRHPKKIKYLHPDLIPIFQETYGILVYQEQVLDIAHRMAGYSLGEADILRRAMGKKKKEIMEKEKIKFVAGCVKNGYPEKTAIDIYSFIEKFASYGFNKSHSASYAVISYWTAYMKANYPIEFMAALLTAELQGVAGPMREEKMAQALEECRRMEIPVLPPDANVSDHNFTIEGNSIRFGLSAIKNVGASAIDSIIEARKTGPFIGFKDFLMRVDLRKVNKKTVESLIKAGFFEKFANRATLLAVYPQLVKEITDRKIEIEQGQFALFSNAHEEVHNQDTFAHLPEVGEDELCDMEREVIGFLLTKNPLNQYKEIIERKIKKRLGDLTTEDVKETYILAGCISAKKVIKTKKDNAEMAFLSVFDQTGTIEVIVFPKTYLKLKNMLNMNVAILFKGKIDNKDDKLTVILDNAVDLERTKQVAPVATA
jgi:DNA polymerase-3 subunit alpha